MNRRDILRITALASGAALSAPLVSSLLSSCQPPASAEGESGSLHFFTPEEFDFLTQLVDTMLPETDSPAASAVGVHTMIDAMVGEAYPAADREAYQKGFAALSQYLQGQEDLTAALQGLEKPAQAVSEDVRQAYLDLKQQTIAYYLTSREIGTRYLNYLPVPGEYDPCIRLSEVEGGKAWAL